MEQFLNKVQKFGERVFGGLDVDQAMCYGNGALAVGMAGDALINLFQGSPGQALVSAELSVLNTAVAACGARGMAGRSLHDMQAIELAGKLEEDSRMLRMVQELTSAGWPIPRQWLENLEGDVSLGRQRLIDEVQQGSRPTLSFEA